MFYEIPDSLDAEISELENKIGQFREGRLDAQAFKARRVPFGVYEQRSDNTFMLRIRCPGGAVTPRQLRAVAALSQKYTAAALHITTRQEFQIHDLKLEEIIPAMRELLQAGLSSRGGGGNTVRNITASFDSGVARDEVFDVSPHAFALTSRLIAEADSWALPRKYKIAFSSSADDNSRAVLNDLGFIARIQDGIRGFEVYVAGGMGSKPQAGHLLHAFAPESEVYFIAAAIKRLFNQHGNRKNRHAARLRFLWNSLGESRFKDLYRQELEAVRQSGAQPLNWKDRGINVTAPLQPNNSASPDFQIWRNRYVVEQKQAGLFMVLIPIFLGNIAAEHAIALADFLIPIGDDVLRATIDQNLCLRNIPEAYLLDAHALIKTLTPLAGEPRFLSSSVACTGASTCKLGITQPRGALTAIANRLRKSNLELDSVADLKMNLSGCPNTCGAHITADLGFFGKVARKDQRMYPSYAIVAGARIGNGEARLAQAFGEVSARDLPAFVSEFLSDYISNKSRYESYAGYLEHAGTTFIKSWCANHREIPDLDEDKNYYYDWGANDPFSLAGRGVGECSAGLFDLIESDLKRLNKLRGERDVGPSRKDPELLYEMTLSASRMLLITRAVEPRTNVEVFSLFLKHFIEAGLVDASYRPLIEAARDENLSYFLSHDGDVENLAAAMEELYGKMDNSLRFPGECAAKKETTSKIAASVSRDFRGVACPMNFVKTKLALAGLKAGDLLKVLLDEGAPIENVPRSVSGEGHKILEQAKEGDHWSVLIEKV